MMFQTIFKVGFSYTISSQEVKRMNEVLKNRLKENKGKVIQVFLKEPLGFRFLGKLTNFDDNFVEILDYKTNAYKLISIDNIKDLDVVSEVGE